MHGAHISHNDIRPETIYYSKQKNDFVIGSFSNCSKGDPNNYNRSLYEADIMMLGSTLLGAFYLTMPIDLAKAKHQNLKYAHKYPILNVLQSMV